MKRTVFPFSPSPLRMGPRQEREGNGRSNLIIMSSNSVAALPSVPRYDRRGLPHSRYSQRTLPRAGGLERR
ncbi:MAG: hypothetical protein AMJ94_03155 [Deltaproteobacteria bacterium SM23_61]|nr:MAG: hypothetical protein AMJ94_03155 [Deltaproteobacteria bacterium SM23_61]